MIIYINSKYHKIFNCRKKDLLIVDFSFIRRIIDRLGKKFNNKDFGFF